MLPDSWMFGLYNARRDGRIDDDELNDLAAQWNTLAASKEGHQALRKVIFGKDGEAGDLPAEKQRAS